MRITDFTTSLRYLVLGSGPIWSFNWEGVGGGFHESKGGFQDLVMVP